MEIGARPLRPNAPSVRWPSSDRAELLQRLGVTFLLVRWIIQNRELLSFVQWCKEAGKEDYEKYQTHNRIDLLRPEFDPCSLESKVPSR
jgi:hypothetical protein